MGSHSAGRICHKHLVLETLVMDDVPCGNNWSTQECREDAQSAHQAGLVARNEEGRREMDRRMSDLHSDEKDATTTGASPGYSYGHGMLGARYD